MAQVMEMTAPLEVGIAVRDLDGMIAFYRDVLGLAFVSVHDMGPAEGKATALSDAGYQIARLQAPGGERVKLVRDKARPAQPPNPPRAGAEFWSGGASSTSPSSSRTSTP